MNATHWTEQDWGILQKRIGSGLVTPVLGAGASVAIIGTAAALAESWAKEINYPFTDRSSLSAVAQYVATMLDRARPGEYISEALTARLDGFAAADLQDRHDPYRSLPRYPFSMWLTTNYDDMIKRALNAANKPPSVAVAQWAPSDIYWDRTPYDLPDDLKPDPKQPLIFHLHGWYGDPASMVITEADYLEFLEQMAGASRVLPRVVEHTIATTSLLFIGYSFRDINLQLVLRQWTIPRVAYAVRPFPAEMTEAQCERYATYYPEYLKKVTGADFKVYWGTGAEFCADLDRLFEAGG